LTALDVIDADYEHHRMNLFTSVLIHYKSLANREEVLAVAWLFYTPIDGTSL